MTEKVKFANIDQYHEQFEGLVLEKLNQIRQIINSIAPEAKEVISYNMPAFKQNGIVVYYAAFSKHVGFYPTPSAINMFADELVGFKTSKGAVQFPFTEELPAELIRKMVIFRINEDMIKGKNR